MVINTPTKIFCGKDELKKLVNELKDDRVLFVTGKSKRILKTDIFADLEKMLKLNNIPYFFYSNVTTNPTKEQVDLGIETCKNNKCSAIVGIGGGSVIDVSKAISFAIVNHNFWEYIETPHDDNRCTKIICDNNFSWHRK